MDESAVIHLSAADIPLQSWTFFTKYFWEGKRAQQQVTKWKTKLRKCQIQAHSFLSRETNHWLSPGDDDWLQKQISAVVTFCTPAELEHSEWDDEFNLCCTPTVYSAVGARVPCAITRTELLRVRESGGGGEEKQMEGRIWKQGEKHWQRKLENKRLHIFFVFSFCVSVCDGWERAQPRSEGNY